jgi:peptidoglycan/xylan/chitin deacetylase (PgdA/CDA1 family)
VSALLVTYHGLARGGGPLLIEPGLFADQLDRLEDAGATFLTVSELAACLRSGTLHPRAVAITFDDGLRSVHEHAAPLLAGRGLPATVFCVAGLLGAESDWPSARPGAPRLPLMTAAELAELADAGFEIGSHGMEHAPLVAGSDSVLRREVAESRLVLEQAVGVTVTSFAYPYGAGPAAAARRLVARTYASACSTALGAVTSETDPHALPRVDAHYLRRPETARRAVAGRLPAYLRARGLGARVRRVLRKDYVPAADALHLERRTA